MANFYFCISLPLSYFLNPYNVCVPFLISASSHPCQFTCVVSRSLTFQTAFPPYTRKQPGFSRSFRRSSLQSGVFAACVITTCLSVASIRAMSFESRMNQGECFQRYFPEPNRLRCFPRSSGPFARLPFNFHPLYSIIRSLRGLTKGREKRS